MNYREFTFAVVIVVLLSLVFPPTSWLTSIALAVIGLVGSHYLDRNWDEVKEWLDKLFNRK